MQTPKGNALVAAIVVLLLASVVTLLTLHVGLFEQRTSGNLLRMRVAGELAEAAVAQGASVVARTAGAIGARPAMETLRGAGADDGVSMRRDSGCGTTCGDVLPRGGGRGSRRRWRRGCVRRAHAAAGRWTHCAGRRVRACRLWRRRGAVSRGSGRRCALHDGSRRCGRCAASTPSSVSRAFLDEGARATVAQTFARKEVFAPNVRMPPVIASGAVDLRAPLHVVANANAGGDGLPVSAWSRKDVRKSAANTCQAGEFFDGGAPAVEGGVATCDACRCPVGRQPRR